MNLQEFLDTYKPVIPEDKQKASLLFINGQDYSMETYGDAAYQLKQTLQEDSRKIFTIKCCMGEFILVNGFKSIDRVGHVITEVPYEGGYLEIDLNDRHELISHAQRM